MQHSEALEKFIKQQTYVAFCDAYGDVNVKWIDLDGGFYVVTFYGIKLMLGWDQTLKTLDDVLVALNEHLEEPIL